MNGYYETPRLKRWLNNEKYIFKFLKYLRISEYLNYKKRKFFIYWIPYLFYAKLYRRYSLLCGYQVPYDTLGFAVRLPHYGLVINGVHHIGNYCSIMHNVVIADAYEKHIGNGIFFGTNVVVAKSVRISDGVQIAANSFVNKSIEERCVVVGGVPAKVLKKTDYWYMQEEYLVNRYERIEKKGRK